MNMHGECMVRTLHLDHLVVVNIHLLQSTLLDLGLSVEMDAEFLHAHCGHGVTNKVLHVEEFDVLLHDDFEFLVGLGFRDVDGEERLLAFQGKVGLEGPDDGVEFAVALCFADELEVDAIRCGGSDLLREDFEA